MVPGLADPYMVSFESVNFPGYYMRHTSDGRVELQSYRESFQFKSDATFRRVPGLVNPGMTSFAAHNRSDMFLRHDKFLLRVEKTARPGIPGRRHLPDHAEIDRKNDFFQGEAPSPYFFNLIRKIS